MASNEQVILELRNRVARAEAAQAEAEATAERLQVEIEALRAQVRSQTAFVKDATARAAQAEARQILSERYVFVAKAEAPAKAGAATAGGAPIVVKAVAVGKSVPVTAAAAVGKAGPVMAKAVPATGPANPGTPIAVAQVVGVAQINGHSSATSGSIDFENALQALSAKYMNVVDVERAARLKGEIEQIAAENERLRTEAKDNTWHNNVSSLDSPARKGFGRAWPSSPRSQSPVFSKLRPRIHPLQVEIPETPVAQKLDSGTVSELEKLTLQLVNLFDGHSDMVK